MRREIIFIKVCVRLEIVPSTYSIPVALESLTLYNRGSNDKSMASADCDSGSSENDDMWRCKDFGAANTWKK